MSDRDLDWQGSEVLPAAGLGAVPGPIDAVAGLGDYAVPEPTPEEEEAAVMRSRSLGPRPALLDRQAAPIEAPDLGATAAAGAQSVIQSTGAALGGAPLAAGSAARSLGRGMAQAPTDILRIYDAVEMAEQAGEPEAGPVGGIANVYRAADRAARDEMRAGAAANQTARDEAGTGQGLQAVGRTLQGAGRSVMQAADEAARATFPVAPEREGDFAVRSARVAGSLPAVLGAAAVGGPAAAAGVIGSQVYAGTFEDARRTLLASGVSEEQADERAADAATANAFLQAGLMTVPFVRLLDRMAPGAQRDVLSTLRSMAVSGAEFGGSNAIGRVVENALARGGYDSDRDLMAEVRESLGPEAFVGAVLPGAAAAGRAVRQGGRAPSAAPEVVEAAQAVEEAARAAQAAPADIEAGYTLRAPMPADPAIPGRESATGSAVDATVDATLPVPPIPPPAAYQAAVERFSRATGLPEQVRVRLVDRLVTPEGGMVDARYEPAARLISVAMDTDPALAVSRVFHEGGGHVALEFAGPRERLALERAADRWLAQPIDEASVRPGADLAAPEMRGARTNLDYIARLNRLDLAEQAGRDLAREEAIAHLAEMHLARSLAERPLVTRALDQMTMGIGRLASALRGEGFTTADSVFSAMTSGRARGRPADVGPAPVGAPALASMRAWHGTPHTFAAEREAILPDGQRVRLRPGAAVDPGLQAAIDAGQAQVRDLPQGRFDYQRINTGEGAQAYGHGLYFADNRDVAESYARDLPMQAVETVRQAAEEAASSMRGLSLSAEEVRGDLEARARDAEINGAPPTFVEQLRRMIQDERAIDALSRLSRSEPEELGAESAEAVRAWRTLNEAVERLTPPGRVYEVNIEADPGRMLDWGRPLPEQPANVRRALDDIGVRDERPSYAWGDARVVGAGGEGVPMFSTDPGGARLMRGEVVRPGPDQRGPWEVRVGTDPRRMTTVGVEGTRDAAMRTLQERISGRDSRSMPGSRAYLLASAHSGTRAGGSAALRERGVPGIRYLDGLSRDGDGPSTRNTVTFSDDIVEILARYSRREGSTGVAGTYSALGRAVDKLQERASARQYLAALRNAKGVKPEEMAWTGLDAMLEQAGDRRVTRQEIQEWLRANDLGLEVVERGEGLREDASADDLMAVQAQVVNEAANLFGFPRDGEGVHMVRPRGRLLPPEGSPMRALVDRVTRRLEQDRFEDDEYASEALRDVLMEEVPYDAGGLRPFQQGARGGGEPVKYAGYQVPGGRNYGEALIILPKATDATPRRSADFNSSHWSEPNVLGHVRFNEREDARGRPVLFLEELQSDWHQEGRSRGYQDGEADRLYDAAVDAMELARRDNVAAHQRGDQAAIEESSQRLYDAGQAVRIARHGLTPSGVPDAPFRTSWPALIVKRMIAQAVANGQDVVAWTDGQIQAERWGSGGGTAQRVSWNPQTGQLLLYGEGSGWPIQTLEGITSAAKLREAIGLDAATRVEEAARDWKPPVAPDPGPMIDEVPSILRDEAEGGLREAADEIEQWALARMREAESGLPAGLWVVDAELLKPERQSLRIQRERAAEISRLQDAAEKADRMASLSRDQGALEYANWYDREAASLAAAAYVLEQARDGVPHEADPPDSDAAALFRELRDWARSRASGETYGAEVTLPWESPVRLGDRARGMQGFYDGRLPAEVSRLIKPLGGQVRSTVISTAMTGGPDTRDPAPRHVYAVEITPQMRRAIEEGGFPLFARREGAPADRGRNRPARGAAAGKDQNRRVPGPTMPLRSMPRNRDRRPPEDLAAGGLVGLGYAEGGAVPPPAAPVPVGGLGGAMAPAAAPPPPAAAPAAPAPNVGAGAVDPETRGALQGLEMWKMAAGLTGRGGLF